MPIFSRIRTAWNAFVNTESPLSDFGVGPPTYTSASPSRPRRRTTNERTIIASIYTRVAIDVADIPLRHALIDDEGQYKEDVDSFLNTALTLEPNLDQSPRAWRQDVVMTLFDKGVAVLVPVDTTLDPETRATTDIVTLRVGEITAWYPQHVKVSLYNEAKGVRQEIVLEKRQVAIVENPLYTVMNEPNSTYQRLVRKLALLDVVDEQSSSGKLDLIIQLPYVIKSDARKQQAEQRRTDIELQLKDSKYGIAYTDGTEKITQLNRPAENNLLKQVEYLTEELYDQLGLSKDVISGTADEKTMINYHNRTVKPIVEAIVEAMQRTFIGHIRSAKNERILYFRDPFKLVALAEFAEIADKLTRNEILTGNELRSYMGIKPSTDPKADELRNSNMPRSDTELPAPAGPSLQEVDQLMNQVFDQLSSDIDKIAGGTRE